MNGCGGTTKSEDVTNGKVAVVACTFLMMIPYMVAVVLSHVKPKAEVTIK